MAGRHKRERLEGRLSRREGKKRPYDRMLIVCEGEKTEVNYFQSIRREKRLPNADIEIVPSAFGTAPQQIVEYALAKFSESGAFERVYVVFDRDDHLTYHNALAMAEALAGKLKNDNKSRVVFKAVPSVPNFELWILLHFRDVLAPIHRSDVYAELKRPGIYPDYQKNSESVFADTKDRLPKAFERAAKLRASFSAYDGTNPYTEVDVLTGELLKIAGRF